MISHKGNKCTCTTLNRASKHSAKSNLLAGESYNEKTRHFMGVTVYCIRSLPPALCIKWHTALVNTTHTRVHAQTKDTRASRRVLDNR